MSLLLNSDISNRKYNVQFAETESRNEAQFQTLHNNSCEDLVGKDKDLFDNNLHLGECPSLIQNINKSKVKVCYIAIFRIKKSTKGKPFIQYNVEKTSIGSLIFPNILPELLDSEHELKYIENTILDNVNYSISKVGYFPYDVESGTYYGFYEAKVKNTIDETIDNSTDTNAFLELTNNYWITPKEIINDDFLNNNIEKPVYDFINEFGEGASRLYNKGNFIPSPEIVYIGASNYLTNLLISKLYNYHDKSNLIIGDIKLGLLSAFFNINNKNETLEISSKIRNGNILRLAFWNSDTIIPSTTYSINDIANDIANDLNVYNIDIDDCEILSKHCGKLIHHENKLLHIDFITFLEMIKSKNANLFIFE